MLLVGGAGALSRTDRLVIRDIDVSGANSVSSERVEEHAEAVIDDGAFHLFSRRNIFLYPRSSIEEALASEFPRIDSVSVSRRGLLAQAVRITVEERDPFALWCDEAGCYLMDSNGFVFASSQGEETQLAVKFSGGLSRDADAVGQSFLPNAFSSVQDLIARLPAAGCTPATFTVEDAQDYTVGCLEGYAMKSAFASDAETVARNLKLSLSSDALSGDVSELEYVDLRFGNRVYYKTTGE